MTKKIICSIHEVSKLYLCQHCSDFNYIFCRLYIVSNVHIMYIFLSIIVYCTLSVFSRLKRWKFTLSSWILENKVICACIFTATIYIYNILNYCIIEITAKLVKDNCHRLSYSAWPCAQIWQFFYRLSVTRKILNQHTLFFKNLFH